MAIDLKQLVGSNEKLLMFALYGALGCAVGALAGEVLLRPFTAGPAAAGSSSGASGSSSGGADTRTLFGDVLFSPEVQKRVNDKGGKGGDVQIALLWNNHNDLDLHCVDPFGERIYYKHKLALRSRGELDIDRNVSPPYDDQPVEHITWAREVGEPGHYQVFVNHYANHGGTDPTEYQVEVIYQGQHKSFTGSIQPREMKPIFEFDVVPPGQLPAAAPAVPVLALVGAVLMTGLRSALMAVGLGLALVAGQNRYAHRPLLAPREATIVGLGGLAAGLIAGGLPQVLYGVAQGVAWLNALGFLAGWVILGAILGWGMGLFVPNLASDRAAVLGGAGGLVGGLVFLPLSGSPALARFVGAAILGLAIGLAVALIEALVRKAWLEVAYGGGETRSVNLGIEPVSIGSNTKAATIYARGAAPVAYSYRFIDAKVKCQDMATGEVTELSPGSSQQVGAVTVTVRTASAASQGPAPATAATMPVYRPSAPQPTQPSTVPPQVKVPPPLSTPPTRPAPQPPVTTATVSPAPPSSPQPASQPQRARDPNGCPGCGRVNPGAAGRRYCMVCDLTY